MTILRAHRVGAQPRTATRITEPHAIILGPDLPSAACKGLAPLFDRAVLGETPPERDERRHQAIRVCRRCPELADCLNARLSQPELGDGIWGGQEFDRTRHCTCGAAIESSNPRKVHCSDRCKTAKRRPNTPTRTLRCPCGTTFSTRSPIKTYCTGRCQKHAENQRRRGVAA